MENTTSKKTNNSISVLALARALSLSGALVRDALLLVRLCGRAQKEVGERDAHADAKCSAHADDWQPDVDSGVDHGIDGRWTVVGLLLQHAFRSKRLCVTESRVWM